MAISDTQVQTCHLLPSLSCSPGGLPLQEQPQEGGPFHTPLRFWGGGKWSRLELELKDRVSRISQ